MPLQEPMKTLGNRISRAGFLPLPVADPFVRPMHRQCVLKGCEYRSRFLFAAGWGLAALFLLGAVVMGIQSARSREALLKENTFLSQQVNAQREQLPTPSPPPSPPPDVLEKEPGGGPRSNSSTQASDSQIKEGRTVERLLEPSSSSGI
jgi:hypothetical protein